MGLRRCSFPMRNRLDRGAYRTFDWFNVRFLEGIAHERHQLVIVNSDRACLSRCGLQIKKEALFGLRQLLGLRFRPKEQKRLLRYQRTDYSYSENGPLSTLLILQSQQLVNIIAFLAIFADFAQYDIQSRNVGN